MVENAKSQDLENNSLDVQKQLLQEIEKIRKRQTELEEENKKLQENIKNNQENKKQVYNAADLIALKNKNGETKPQISFETIEVVNAGGNVVKYEIAKMKLPSRGGAEVVQQIGTDFVIKHDNMFFDEIYNYYKEKYQQLENKLPFKDEINQVLISRGILSLDGLKKLRQSYLHHAITIRYPESVYRDVLMQVKEYLVN